MSAPRRRAPAPAARRQPEDRISWHNLAARKVTWACRGSEAAARRAIAKASRPGNAPGARTRDPGQRRLDEARERSRRRSRCGPLCRSASRPGALIWMRTGDVASPCGLSKQASTRARRAGTDLVRSIVLELPAISKRRSSRAGRGEPGPETCSCCGKPASLCRMRRDGSRCAARRNGRDLAPALGCAVNAVRDLARGGAHKKPMRRRSSCAADQGNHTPRTAGDRLGLLADAR